MNIESEILALKERNQRGEAEKAWETSLVRKLSIIFITYLFALVLMIVIKVPDPHLNALVPTMGFFLSTLSLGFLKSIWIKKYQSQNLRNFDASREK